jgi:hypothetical protein
MTRHWVCLVAALTLVSCSGKGSESNATDEAATGDAQGAAGMMAEAAPPLTLERVQRIAGIAVQIERDPTSAEQVLAEHGLTAEELEAALYDIAADPSFSAAFAEAKRMAYDQ